MDRIGRRDPARVIAIGGLIGLCFAAGSLALHRIDDGINGPGFALSRADGQGIDAGLPVDPWGVAPSPSRSPLAVEASGMMAMAGMAPPSRAQDTAIPAPFSASRSADSDSLACDRFPCETLPIR